MHVFTAQLAFSAVPAWLRQVVLSQHGHHACNNSRLSCSSSRLDKSFSWLLNPCASLRPIRPQLLDGLQAPASLPGNHHLVDWRVFPRNTCHHCRAAQALAQATIPIASSSACSVICFRSRLFSGFSASLRGPAFNSRSSPQGPWKVLEPSSSSGLLPCVKLSGLICWLESRLRDSLFLHPRFLSTLDVVALLSSVRPCPNTIPSSSFSTYYSNSVCSL